MRSARADRPPRARRALGGAALALTLLAAGCSAEEYVAPPPAASTDVVDAGQAAATLAALQSAVVAGDGDAAEALGADGASELLGAVAENATDLGLTDVSFTYVTETGETSQDGWTGLVAVTWRVEGFDRTPARTELPVRFADGGRAIAALADRASGRLPVWLSGRVGVRRSPDALVLGVASDAELAAYDEQVRRAVEEVRTVLGGAPKVVVEVPADAARLDRALDVASGTYASIAAVTAPVDGSRTDKSPVHVFVNPAVHDSMDADAAQVVATHEVVHAVTGAVLAQRVPLWLVEGFADYVALRDVDLPITRTAGQLIKEVRADGVPDTLPADSDFNPASGHLGSVYEAAWQVVVTLAEQGGEATVVALYRAALDGADVVAELAARFGWTEEDLTAAWQQRVAALG